MRQKVIIDCDPGIDDSLALILAFHSPELDVRGVSGVSGNVSLNKVMANIEKILTLIKSKTGPVVARGADCPLEGECRFAEDVHGEYGLGDSQIDVRAGMGWGENFPGTAPEFLSQIASANPGEVTVIAIGPLTNLGLALRQDPASMKQLKEIIVMGGALREKGNITPYAEFNFFVDPLAAQIVLNSAIPITLVPLDVTQRVFLAPKTMERLEPLSGRFARFVIESTGYDKRTKEFRGGRKRFYLHDALAVGAVIRPDLFRKTGIPVDVETERGEHYGRLTERGEAQVSADQNVDVCLEVDGAGFLDLFLSRVGDQDRVE